MLSRDGVTWTPELVDPLFDSSVRWVPGDERTESFFVRNDSAQAGRLAIDILGTPVHTLLDTGDLDIDAQGAGGAWVSVSTPGTHRLLSDGSVPADDARRVDVTVHFDSASTNVSQLKSLELAFRVSLVQDVDEDGSDSDGSDGSDDSDDASGLLPDTGAPSPWWALGGLVTLGIGLLMSRRTPRRQVRP
jgi:LPXTG-motif cell wall-anchored protein